MDDIDLENMTPEQEIVDQSTVVFKLAADQNKDTVTYKEFCDSLMDDRGVDVAGVAKAAGFTNGSKFLESLGFKINDAGDLVVKTTAEDEDSKVTKFIDGARREVIVGDVQPPRQLYEVHIFDGDETKLMPGMRVKISTGNIISLDSIPFPDRHDVQARKLQLQAGRNFRKKVRNLVKVHNKYCDVIAKSAYNKTRNEE
uniref:Uncharacterized protein n=1 Tax=Panagrolaimus sp. ES5 TaxID=591445 RepID=A0AC34FZS1_9BILA